jgi:hypothetical protein
MVKIVSNYEFFNTFRVNYLADACTNNFYNVIVKDREDHERPIENPPDAEQANRPSPAR